MTESVGLRCLVGEWLGRIASSAKRGYRSRMRSTSPPEGESGSGDAPGWRRWLHWSNLLMLVVAVWAAPRLLPHVGALVGVSNSEARRPVLDVVTRDGRPITLDSLRGKIVLVNVWATWCAPCRIEMPALQQIADAYADDAVVVLGLSVDRGPAQAVDAFLAERGITYPVAIVGSNTLAELGGVDAYPTSFLLDAQGVVQHKVVGPVGPLTLRPALWRLTRALRNSVPRDSARLSSAPAGSALRESVLRDSA
jgi:cytochrome c biogenesis protein CcmG/thiol:disulfide interchange protein DsbE